MVAIRPAVISGKDQVSVFVKFIAANRRIRSRIDCISARPYVCDHIDVFPVRCNRRIDKSRRLQMLFISVISQIIGKRILPVFPVIRRTGHNRIQSAGVSGMIPSGVARSHKRAVVQCNKTRNAEIIAASRSRRERLSDGFAIRRFRSPFNFCNFFPAPGVFISRPNGPRQRRHGENSGKQACHPSFLFSHPNLLLY